MQCPFLSLRSEHYDFDAIQPLTIPKGLFEFFPNTTRSRWHFFNSAIGFYLIFIVVSIFGRRSSCHFLKGPVEGVDGIKATFRGNRRDIDILPAFQKLFGMIQSVKGQKLPEMNARQVMERMGKIFFIVTEFFRNLRQRDVFHIVLGKIGYNLLV